MKPELIEIAREAGFTIATGMNKGQWPCVDGVDIEDELTKFAELLGKKRLGAESLTQDERQQIVELLDKEGHDGKDFEPECPLCTARKKLAPDLRNPNAPACCSM